MTPTPGGSPTAVLPRPAGFALLVAGIVVVAADLRPSIVSTGPLLPELRADLGLGGAAAGVLGAVPLLAFAAASPLVPRIAHRWGAEVSALVALLVLAAGVVLRSAGGVTALFAGTVVLAVGIAGLNVLLPVVIALRAPERFALLTSVYATVLAASAALAAGVAVPLTDATGGWRPALAVWAVPALLAAAVWWPQVRRARRERAEAPLPDARGDEEAAGQADGEADGGMGGASGPAHPDPADRPRLPWRSPLAWAVTGYLGLQALAFYSSVAWLPTMARDLTGATPAGAGVVLLVAQLAGIVGSLTLPWWLRGRADQRLVAVVAPAAFALAWAGTAVVPEAVLGWAVLMGWASGSAFGLSLALIGLRTRDAAGASALSAMAQSLGYLLAAGGPVLVGAVHDAAGSWTPALVLLAAVAVLNAGVGLLAGRSGAVTARTAA